MLAAAAFILTACSGLQEDGGEKSIRINLPPIVSASGNSRALSGDRLPTLKTETRRYRVTVNGMTREGTVSSYEFTLPVGIRATAIIECLNSSGEVIIRAVKDFTVSGGENSIDINLKNDGNEIIPSAPQPVSNQVTYSYGEATIGNPGGLPSDPATYNEGDVFEVQDGSVMTWTHALDGNAFKEWSASTAIEPENGGAATTAPQAGQKYKMPAGGVTLTAQWNKKSYSITYDMNAQGSGNTPSSTSINQGSVLALEDYTVDGTTPQSVSAGVKNYTFTEWSDGNGNTYAVGGKITKVTGDITLTAQWSDKDVWTVTYSKGNTQATEQSITGWENSKNAVEGESVTLPTLQAAGYTFTGWQINSATYQGGTSYTPNASVAATAQWTANTYKVKFDAGSGTGSIPDQTFTYDTPQGLTTVGNSMTKTGYTFNGWSGNGQAYTDGQSVSNLTATNNGEVTLTAQWTVNSYQVTYALDGGSGGPASGDVQYNASVSLNAPTKTGYTFAGWSDGSTTYGGTSGNNSLSMPAQAITLTAQWTVNSYQVTYALDGGSGGPASGNVQYNASVALDAPTKTGYTFTGWSDGSTTYGGTSGNNSLSMPAQAITLTAQWEAELKSTPVVGDIIMKDGSLKKSTDTIDTADAIAVVYKVDTNTKTAWAVGKKRSNPVLAWAKDGTIGYSQVIAGLVTHVEGSEGNYTFSGYIDGSEGLTELQKVATDYSADNYPAWNWCASYGTQNCPDTSFTTGWYFPSVKELFDIYLEKDGVENSIRASGGDDFGYNFYISSSDKGGENLEWSLQFTAYTSNGAATSGRSTGSGKKSASDQLCAVRQFTY